MEPIQPTAIPSVFFDNSVITCVTLGDAERYHLPYIRLEQQDPEDMSPIRPAGAADDTPAVIERLDWIDPNLDPNLLPVFTAILTVFPVQLGTTIPRGQNVRVCNRCQYFRIRSRVGWWDALSFFP
jgi:hypothetical protein